MKRPFESVREIFFDNIARSRENAKFIFEHSDKLMVWIVGFSIGGLSLIVSQLTEFNQSFTHCILKGVLILLSISIVSGIIYRIAFYFYQIQYKNIEIFLETAFSNREFMNIEPDDLSEETDIKEVVRRLRDDFGEDLSYIFNIHASVDDNHKTILLEDMKKHYAKVGEWAKKDFINAIDFAKDTYKKAFGLNDRQINNVFEKSNSTTLLKIYGWISKVCFLISCTTFISVIIILCYNY